MSTKVSISKKFVFITVLELHCNEYNYVPRIECQIFMG